MRFYKFPHTAHLVSQGNATLRGDKVMAPGEVAALLKGEVIVEEKLDGANIGLSIDSFGHVCVRNRGRVLEYPYSGQFSRLDGWIRKHEDAITKHFAIGGILFGEWCAAVHSIKYNALPDWFLVFDVFDEHEGKFWSVNRRNELAADSGLFVVPELFRGVADIALLNKLLSESLSRYSTSPLEGLIIRQDEGEWCQGRAKLVRADFVQSIDQHWTKGGLRWNRLGC